jgi:hypothetical protein
VARPAELAQQSEALSFWFGSSTNKYLFKDWRAAKTSRDTSARLGRVPMQPMLHNKDILTCVFQKLPIMDLLRCTLVCRVFCATVDECASAAFQRRLRWNGYFLEKWAAIGSKSHIVFDSERRAFVGSVLVDKQSIRHMWRFNVVPKVSSFVSVSLRVFLPVDKIRLRGNEKLVARFLELEDVSVDVRNWEIMDVNVYEDKKHEGLGNMLLRAVLDDKSSSLKIDVEHDILVEFQSVPVVPMPRLNYRTLCVMKSVLSCMHCFQRNPKWQSVDVEDACHRVLCGVCFDALFVSEFTLCGKWRINSKIQAPHVSRSCFVYHQNQNHHRVYPDAAVPCMLKQEIAEALGHASWIHFLRENHTRPDARRHYSNRYSFCH